MKIETPVTKLIGIDLPIIQAGMSWASSNAALPAAVSNAGGLGTLAVGPMRIEDIAETFRAIRAWTGKPFAVNMPLYRKGSAEVLDLLEELKPDVLVASQGGPQAYLERFRKIGTICFHTVASERHAEKAADAGVDGLVVVGGEAGGHPPPDLISGQVMIRAIRRKLPDIPIISSGGWADGSGLAAALALGADAAAFGTRFLTSPEAGVSDAYKQRVLAAGIGDTRTTGRGIGMIRSLANSFTDEMERMERDGTPVETRKEYFSATTLKDVALGGDPDLGKLEAGQSCGLIDELLPAGQLVERIAAEASEVLDRLAGLRGR